MPITIQAALLGVVQGLTEFLPVSSSAHLILARACFGFDSDKFGLTFDVACHVGTLIAVLIYFRRDIGEMIAALPYLFRPGPGPVSARGLTPEPSVLHRAKGSGVTPRGQDRRQEGARPELAKGRESARLIWLLAAGTFPAAVVGLLFKGQIEEHMRTPMVAAVALALGGIMLLVAERSGSKTRGERTLTMVEAVWIGCAQALALVPGVSRSGATLTVAVLLGLRRAEGARFVFLLAIPAILGAAASEAPRLLKAGLGDTATLFLIGIVTSALVGYVTVKYFIRYLGNHSLDAFAWYRIALAGTVVIWLWRP